MAPILILKLQGISQVPRKCYLKTREVGLTGQAGSWGTRAGWTGLVATPFIVVQIADVVHDARRILLGQARCAPGAVRLGIAVFVVLNLCELLRMFAYFRFVGTS